MQYGIVRLATFTDLNKAEIGGVFAVYAVLLEHFLHDRLGGVSDGQEEGFVGDVRAQGGAVDLGKEGFFLHALAVDLGKEGFFYTR